jgi:hypothetical protein
VDDPGNKGGANDPNGAGNQAGNGNQGGNGVRSVDHGPLAGKSEPSDDKGAESGDRGMHRGKLHVGCGGPAAEACKTQLDTCLDDKSQDHATCVKGAHACVHAAISANFKALCDAKLAHCHECSSAANACDQLAATCTAGVSFPDTPEMN